MQQGVIKFFREDKGYGFIERDQGGDLFVHISEVDENFDTLAKGQRVSFEEGASRRTGRPEAKNVTVIEARLSACGGTDDQTVPLAETWQRPSGNEMLTLTALFLAWFGRSRMPKCDLPL
jgi:cold shock protein